MMSGNNDENDHVRKNTIDDDDSSINNNRNATVDVNNYYNNKVDDLDVKSSHQNGAANKTGTASSNGRFDDELELNNENPNNIVEPPKPKKRSSKKPEWVQFDDEDKMTVISMPSSSTSIQQENNNSSETAIDTTDNNIAPAVLTTESVHVNITAKSKTSKPSNPISSPPKQTSTVIDIQKMSNTNPTSTIQTTSITAVAAAHHPSNTNTHIQSMTNNNNNNSTISTITTSPISSSSSSAQTTGLRTIELSSGRIREGFVNGDIIVTLLPVNTKWPWITPAIFRPELVPEELMAQGLTLTVEEYVHAMETLVNDVRFTFYNVCYKRVLVCWILFAFCVLIGLLFSGLNGIALFSLGVAWLFLNAAALFFCMWIKLRLSRGLERCMASVNKQLLRHKIILALDDRGKISCHKVNLCFLYYDPAQCVAFLNELIERNEQNGTSIEPGWESRLDVAVNDIVIQGSNTTRVSRKQERGNLLFLRYASRWGNEVIRGLADVSLTEPARHCAPFICPCQYIERHLSCKPRGVVCSCCLMMTDPTFQYQY